MYVDIYSINKPRHDLPDNCFMDRYIQYTYKAAAAVCQYKY